MIRQHGGASQVWGAPLLFLGWLMGADDGVSPREILLAAMHAKWRAGAVDEAVALARIAAPYLHPRARAGAGGGDLARLSDEELRKIAGGISEEAGGGGG